VLIARLPSALGAASDILAALPSATCNICGSTGQYAGPADHLDDLTDPDRYNWREGLGCGGCGSISRERGLIFMLGRLLGEYAPLERWSPQPDLRVMETSGYRGHPPRLAGLFDYFNTDFPGQKDVLDTIDGRRLADVEDLWYPDGFFDVVLTAEVLEHVAVIKAALRELYRVLDPNGYMVIRAPYVHEWRRTSVRVQRWQGRDVHLYPPEYHADQTLVYRIFGRDLLSQLADVGFTVLFTKVQRPEHAIAEMEFVVASKAPFVDITHFVAS
jgi:predicted SAM-dependent methyltransferase